VANAGIFKPDEVFSYSEQVTKPDLSSIEVNLNASLYTTKLAMHYFIKQNGITPSASQEDTSLTLISSGAGIYDVPRMPEYAASKFAARGIMRSLRRTAHYYGSRVNVICPYYVQTTILPNKIYNHIKSKGVSFATLLDAGQCLLRILSDPTVNGHTLFVSPRKWAASGYMDLDLENFEENELRREIQIEQMCSEPVEAGLFAKLYGDR
jgi:NAD(P)-dependent dehydrogenase (short-subunit alcohol dehydrogenase family)